MPSLARTIDVQKTCQGWKAVPRVTAKVRLAARRAVAMAGVPVLADAEIAVLLADDARVREANRQWRDKDSATNVLSFPAVPTASLSNSPFLGDIILAYETVAAEAVAQAKPLDHHLMHLIVHGVLHLIGYDHMTRLEAERMERLETAILASLAVPDPYEGADLMETKSS